jgi:hypothetical protein
LLLLCRLSFFDPLLMLPQLDPLPGQDVCLVVALPDLRQMIQYSGRVVVQAINFAGARAFFVATSAKKVNLFSLIVHSQRAVPSGRRPESIHTQASPPFLHSVEKEQVIESLEFTCVISLHLQVIIVAASEDQKVAVVFDHRRRVISSRHRKSRVLWDKPSHSCFVLVSYLQILHRSLSILGRVLDDALRFQNQNFIGCLKLAEFVLHKSSENVTGELHEKGTIFHTFLARLYRTNCMTASLQELPTLFKGF